MIQGGIIKKTITSLKQRLEAGNGLLTLQLREGELYEAKCTFRSPVREEDLMLFQEKLGCKLPQDYLNFLRITNGCSLFDHPEYGGEAYLYGWQDTFGVTYEEPNEGYLKVAYIYQDDIVIHLKAFNEGSDHYLMVKGHIEHFYDARPLHMNFEQWFDRFIICQGEKYWNWPIYNEGNNNRLRD